jgi:aspartate aminotransferase-like enzyme
MLFPKVGKEGSSVVKSLFRLPGPTPLPPPVLEAMQRPMIPHRGAEFRAFYSALLERLRAIHRTEQDVLIWPGSGSSGWEIALTNLLSPGDAVLAVITGDFGERFARVAGALGLDVRRLDVPWGEAVTHDALREALLRHHDVKAVLLTHNETSTGVTNPLAELAETIRDSGPLVLVDAVSSAAGLPLEVDAWDLDFVLSGSQKAWMCPPGLAIVAVGPRAWEAQARSTNRTWFWDMAKTRDAAAEGSTPTTPPLTLLYALDAAARMILDESVEGVWRRHREVGQAARAGVRSLGLSLLPEPDIASDTVTAFYAPHEIPSREIVRLMAEDHGVTVAGGQGPMTDAIVRVGHMGWVDVDDIEVCFQALGQTLARLKQKASLATGSG